MLQVIRDNAQGFFAWLIIGAIVLAMGLFGLSSYFDDTEEAFQAALVNGEKVTVRDYQFAYAAERNRMRQMFGENFDPDIFDNQIKNSALDNVIDNALLIQKATQDGLFISDDQLAQQIHSFSAFQEDGTFSKARYQLQLDQGNQTISGFEYRFRRGLIADQFVNGIINTSFATQEDIALTYHLRKQQRELAYLTIPRSKFKDQVSVTEEEILSHYDANKDKYKTEEQLKLRYLELSAISLMPKVEINETELEDFYKEQKDRFIVPEERRARHILIEFGDDKTKAEEKANAIAAKAAAGEDFATLAQENTDDIGSKTEGGDLGFFARGVMDENFEDATFSMEPGEVSPVVRSSFGFHIIKLEEIKPSTGKAFSEVKAEIEAQVRREKADKLYFDESERLANLAYENPETLEVAAEELGLEIKTSPLISRRGGAGIFGNRKVIEAAFSDEVIKENQNSAAIETNNNEMVVVRVEEHKLAEPRPLEQVKGQIKTQLENDKALGLAKAEAKLFEDKINNGESVTELAAEKGLSWNEKQWVGRNNSDIASEITQALFSMPRNNDNITKTQGIPLNNGDYSLLAFSGIKDGDIANITEEDKKSIANGIANASGSDSFTILLESIKADAKIEKFMSNL